LKQLNRFARISLKIRAAKQLQGELASSVGESSSLTDEAGRDKQLFQGENAASENVPVRGLRARPKSTGRVIAAFPAEIRKRHMMPLTKGS
jgi:hypothetical protein